MGRIWVIKPAVAFCPLFVPGTCAIRREIMSSGLFADPEDRCHNVCFPRVLRGLSGERLVFDRFTLSGEAGTERDEERETKKAK